MSVAELMDLKRLGIKKKVTVNMGLTEGIENLHFSQLVTFAVRRGEGDLSRRGTLVINTRVDDQYGEQRHTGRTPQARYIVDDAEGVDFTNKKLNQPMSRENAEAIYREMIDYINKSGEVFVANRMLGADLTCAFPFQFISSHASRSLFAINQFRDLPPLNMINDGEIDQDAVTAHRAA